MAASTMPHFVPLKPEWVDEACRLSSQAGWNQTEADWLRLTKVAGAVVRVLWADNAIRASYSVMSFGDVAWIGMILVDEAMRGQGLGRASFSSALEAAKSARLCGLDATDMGKPLYAKFGFKPVAATSRWVRSPQFDSASSKAEHSTMLREISDLDLRASGVDRSGLLRALYDEGADFFTVLNGKEISGYGVLRAGRTARHFGPVVALREEDFGELLDAACQHCRGEAVQCDFIRNSAESALLQRGFEPKRMLTRMMRPQAEEILQSPLTWCAVGFEFG